MDDIAFNITEEHIKKLRNLPGCDLYGKFPEVTDTELALVVEIALGCSLRGEQLVPGHYVNHAYGSWVRWTKPYWPYKSEIEKQRAEHGVYS